MTNTQKFTQSVTTALVSEVLLTCMLLQHAVSHRKGGSAFVITKKLIHFL